MWPLQIPSLLCAPVSASVQWDFSELGSIWDGASTGRALGDAPSLSSPTTTLTPRRALWGITATGHYCHFMEEAVVEGAQQTLVSCTNRRMLAETGCADDLTQGGRRSPALGACLSRPGFLRPRRLRPLHSPRPRAGCGAEGRGGAGRGQMKGAASAAQKSAAGRERRGGLIGHSGRPGGRALDAAAAAPAPGGGPGRSHARPGPGAFSGRRSRAGLRRGGRAVIRVIARLPAGGSPGPRRATRDPS